MRMVIRAAYIFFMFCCLPSSLWSAEPVQRLLPDLVADIEKSVAFLTCTGPDGISQGSGFVIDASAGLVATNCHVIEGSSSVSMTFAGGPEITVLGCLCVQPLADLAVLKIPVDRCPPALPLAAELPRKGQDVITLGSPGGLTNTLSRGVVSAVLPASGLGVSFATSRFRKSLMLVQTDAAIAPGSSGGPLLNMAGEVVGVVTATRTDTQAANFAVGVNELRKCFEAAQRAKEVRPFPNGKKPQSKGSGGPNQAPGALPPKIAFRTISLPTGEVLDVAEMFSPREAFAGKGQTIELKYPNGNQKAWIQVGETGTVAWFHENGKPAAVAEYYQDRLHGKFLSRDKDGSPSLYVEFDRGARHGWLVGFAADQAQVVSSYQRGKLLASYAIGDDGEVTLTHEHKTASTPPDAKFAAALKDTDRRYRDLRTDERNVRLDGRDLVNAYRRRHAAVRAQQSRQEIATKDNARRDTFFKSWLIDAKNRGF